MSRKGAVVLQVGNLPSNRLALTNRVYLSPTVHGHLVEAAASKSSSSASASSTYGGPLVSVGPHVYIAEGHPSVPDDKIALNGLQRRFAQLSLANRVEVRPYDAPAALALAK